MKHQWSVFTKPWKNLTLRELTDLVADLGFDGVEFPVRPGFQITPECAETELPRFAAMLGERGLKLMSVAGETSERVFAACEAAGVPLLRIMVKADPDLGWMKSIEQWRRRLDALQPLCEKYHVTVGVQQHHGFGISTTMEMRYLLEGLDPGLVGAIWDAAHSGLAGEIPEQAIDMIWDKLVLVNLKNAYYDLVFPADEREVLQKKPYFTLGCLGAGSWAEAAAALAKRGYTGPICMPAEYTDEDGILQKIRTDFEFAKNLFDSGN